MSSGFATISGLNTFHDGAWRPVIAQESIIKVKGSDPVKLMLKRTHYGPIVYDESETPIALGCRAGSPCAGRRLSHPMISRRFWR